MYPGIAGTPGGGGGGRTAHPVMDPAPSPRLTSRPASCASDWYTGGPPGTSFQNVTDERRRGEPNCTLSVLAGFDRRRVQHCSSAGFGAGHAGALGGGGGALQPPAPQHETLVM